MGDVEHIARLYRVLFRDMAALQSESVREADQEPEFIQATIENAHDKILLAKEGEKLLRFALIQQKATPPYRCMVPHCYAYLSDLVVEPGYRGKGIGRTLLLAVRAWARARALDYVELNVLAQNQDAMRLYERMGFAECSRLMRLPLEQDERGSEGPA